MSRPPDGGGTREGDGGSAAAGDSRRDGEETVGTAEGEAGDQDEAGDGSGADDGSEAGGGGPFDRRRLLLVPVLLGGVVVPGLLRRALGVAGFQWAGRAVFVLGYAVMLAVLWYGWVRPLEITGPAGRDRE